MMTASPAAPAAFFDGEPLVRMIASALFTLSRQRAPRNPVYEDTVQTAFNHLVLRCLRHDVPPPASVPGMVSWAMHRPLHEWPFGLPDDLDAADGFLIDPQTCLPTQQCLEWVVSAPDPAAEQYENEVMLGVIQQCRVARSPGSYTAFRRLLITRPVLTGTELALLGEDLDLMLLIATIKRSYEAAPGSYLRDGHYAQCARCKCLLVPIEGGRYRCELDRCRREGFPTVERTLDPTRGNGVYHLSRPLRMFITGPGLAETDLEQDLIKKKLQPEMWPNFDTYDLRITLPNKQVWAIDVKDRANPTLLARTARTFTPAPPYDQAFLVVPQYRFDEREAYARIFARHVSDEVRDRVRLMSDEEFLRVLTRELRRIRRITTAHSADGGSSNA
ncbi:hypothetical protein CFP71_14680 [Amycolatopsis thailandensis]|uniref:Fis family transcriptional regulator n=1 Tax=Amycolatopsis thailandensis TaxID=589330 RepID=A0A229SAX4_9PSEU|nr:HU-CCDC81 and SPOR domain-containing protein [Amycolatopsis thailandensis]OXM56077.1 hypothetical protein CFP71_14680 [Amycolatopsis thailandensis]